MYATPGRNSNRRMRRQLIVAPILQGRLMFHVLLYCLASSVVTAVLQQSLASYVGAIPSWTLVAVATLIAAAAVAPWAVWDAARVSNRIVGPFVRVRGAVRRLGNKEPVRPLSVRQGDDWEEWIQDFNHMVSRIHSIHDLKKRSESESVLASTSAAQRSQEDALRMTS